MSSGCVMLARVGAQQMAQMCLAKDRRCGPRIRGEWTQSVVRQNRSAATSEARRLIPNAHCTEALPHDGTE